jgi:hypothetical protein
LSGVRRVLRDLGRSARLPLTRALERKLEYNREWVEGRWPEIFQHGLVAKSTMVFVYEGGVHSCFFRSAIE